MAAYVKNGDQIALMFSKAELNALEKLLEQVDFDLFAEFAGTNPMTVDAARRARRTVEVASEPGSRTGAAIT